MEPLFFKAENMLPSRACSYQKALQWSRFFSKRKIYKLLLEVWSGIERFNGAAFFQSGKFADSATIEWDFTTASMEPLFFKAENLAVTGLKPPCDGDCFNGAAFFQSGKCRTNKTRFCRTGASMEPLFFKAENTDPPAIFSPPLIASMEPLFFKAENVQWFLCFPVERKRLQWSRFFSKRKMSA